MARYQRGSLDSALKVARNASHDSIQYVFATQKGWAVHTSYPPFQGYYKVQGSIVERVEFDTGCPTTEIDWAAIKVKLMRKGN
jgi:hypothetical protein